MHRVHILCFYYTSDYLCFILSYCCPVKKILLAGKIRVDISHEVSTLLIIFIYFGIIIIKSKDGLFTGQQYL